MSTVISLQTEIQNREPPANKDILGTHRERFLCVVQCSLATNLKDSTIFWQAESSAGSAPFSERYVMSTTLRALEQYQTHPF